MCISLSINCPFKAFAISLRGCWFLTLIFKKVLNIRNTNSLWYKCKHIFCSFSFVIWLCLEILPPHAESCLIGKDSDAGRDWGQEGKGTTEDEMAGWHHGLDGHESEWTPGDGDGQGGLACCDSWGRKESDTTEWLNWTEAFFIFRSSDSSILYVIVF